MRRRRDMDVPLPGSGLRSRSWIFSGLSDRDAVDVAVESARRHATPGTRRDAADVAQSALLSILERGQSGPRWVPSAIRAAVRACVIAESERPAASLSARSVARAARAVPDAPERADEEEEDWLEDELSTGMITVEQARKKVFNHLSEGFGVPRAPEGVISEDGAAYARLDVAERGGVVAVAQSIMSSGDWADPLFTPWPFSSVPQRQAIVGFLSDRHTYAEGLWESALDTVTAEPGAVHTLDMTDPANRKLVESGQSEIVGNLFW